MSHIFSRLFHKTVLHEQTKGSERVFHCKKRGHVLLQTPKSRCAVGPLYCQHVWMPCSINFSLNSLARIYETCNMGLQVFWSLHTCRTRCSLFSHFEADIGRSWLVASCSVKGFKCIYTLLCLLGTVFYSLMRLRSKFHSVIPGMDAPAPSPFPLSVARCK